LGDREIKALAENAQQGQQEAIASLFERFYPKMLKYMRYRVGAAVAEDLAGEVFVRGLTW